MEFLVDVGAADSHVRSRQWCGLTSVQRTADKAVRRSFPLPGKPVAKGGQCC